ncbi:MAG: transporter substrate-binding domain-containing protein [Pseudomonadota bacterium]
MRLLRFCLACLLLFQSGSAAALECGSYSVAFYEMGALYYRAPDGAWTGIDKDVIDELARRSDCRFEGMVESRVRIWARLEAGSLDVSVSGIATPEREKISRFLPYGASRYYLLMRNSMPEQARSMEGFLADEHYTLGVVKSFRHGARFDAFIDKLRAQGRVYEAVDFAALFQLFRIHRVHAILAAPAIWVPEFKREKINDDMLVMDWAPNDGVVGALVLSRQRVPEPVAQLLRATLEKMRKDGTLEAIFRRHVGAALAADMMKF